MARSWYCIRLTTSVALVMSFSVLIQVADGQAWLRIVDPDPDNPDVCVYSEENIRLNVGESRTNIPNQCATVSCIRRDSRLQLSYVGCGVMATPPGCRILQTMRRPHPDCCPRLICPD